MTLVPVRWLCAGRRFLVLLVLTALTLMGGTTLCQDTAVPAGSLVAGMSAHLDDLNGPAPATATAVQGAALSPARPPAIARAAAVGGMNHSILRICLDVQCSAAPVAVVLLVAVTRSRPTSSHVLLWWSASARPAWSWPGPAHPTLSQLGIARI